MLHAILLVCLSTLVVVSSVPTVHRPSPSPSEVFPFSKVLDPDGNYILYWKFNNSHITFETHVRTQGYVGLGLSHNGNMFPADIVIGWVKDGVTHFKDRHSEGHYLPAVDTSQDWILLHGEENNFGTILKMIRKLDTCDQEDIKITNDTIRIIYSFSQHDPHSDDSIPYHGTIHRGAKSLMLLTMLTPPSMPNDIKTMDFFNDNYHVPAADTTYLCRVYSLADMKTKHHIIKFEPIVQKGHVALVHHILLYKCPAVPAQYIGYQFKCSDYGYGTVLQRCTKTFFAWATGGEDFVFPNDVGMPIGEDTDIMFMETHYNNPGLRGDYVDSSGIRMYFTPTLRQHDADTLTVGVLTHKWQVIPPNAKDFRSTGFCTETCLNKGLASQQAGVNMFAVLQHAHLLGRGIRTRLYRHGVELEPIAHDENYDFDFQDYRHFPRRRTLQSGDAIVVECKYDSTARTNITKGGLSTSDEMCLSFIFYYPKMNVELCQSLPVYSNIPEVGTGNSPFYGRDGVTPYIESRDWNNKTVVNNFVQKLKATDHLSMCIGRSLSDVTMTTVKPIEPTREFVEPSSCPSNPIHETKMPLKISSPKHSHHPDGVHKTT